MTGAWWRQAASIVAAVVLVAAPLSLVPGTAAMEPVRDDPGTIDSTAERGLLDLGRAGRTRADGGPVTSAIIPGRVNRTSLDLTASYDVRLRLNYDAGTLAGTSTMSVTNTSGGPIDRLELNTIMARLGHLRIASLTVDGVATRPVVLDQTLIVGLGGTLPTGATTRIRIAFATTLQRTISGSAWLFTKAGGVMQLDHWLPWISRARAFDRPNHGDPFVTASSPSVRVRIRTDRDLKVATTGRRVAQAGTSSTWIAANVRDFSVAASPSWTIRTEKVGSIAVSVYSFAGGNGSALMSLATRALRRYQPLMGAYPYPTFRVVESGGGYGSEAPGLIWIPRGLSYGRLPWLVSHETAHQWFPVIVGSDQALEPFADEAMADFLARYLTGTWRASRCPAQPLDRSIYRYSSACYFEVVYVQGGRLIDSFRRRMGSVAFWAAVRDYIDAHRFGLGGTRALLETLDAHTSLDLIGPVHWRFSRIF